MSKIDRRDMIIGGTAFIGLAGVPIAASGAEAGLASAADLLASVRKFTSTLEPDKLKAASFPWSGAEWRNWNYFGVGGYIKPGLRLEQLNAAQKAAAWDLLATVWSPSGLQKAKNVMLLQDILAQSGNGTGQRSSERFSISLFGTPAEAGAWGFRFEGHHLTQSVAVRDNRIVSVTPFSFSSYPNRVAAGKHAGLNTLKDEEGLARRLFGDLSAERQRNARIGELDALQHSVLRRARARQRQEGWTCRV